MTSTILLVEDNPTTRKLVRFTLTTKGYTLLEAEDAASALALAEQQPDLILQDLVLPDMDGFELAGRLRERMGARPVPILAFSGFVSKLEEAKISAVGFDDVIVKPVEPSRLVHIIESHLPAAEREPPDRFGRGLRLLIADDDPIQAKLASYRFTRLGFDVSVVGDGADALRELHVARPAMVVSDVMMPRLDGFQLCVEVRKDPALQGIPLVLMTSGYLDEDERRLAERAGASAFVVRTPDLRDVIAAVRSVLSGTLATPTVTVAHAEVEREHARRVIQQLERQVTINAGVSQRCALLSAELSILSRISEALTQHADFDASLDEVLAACFDAGGISSGALYTFPSAAEVRARSFGKANVWERAGIADFFGEIDGLRVLLRKGGVVTLPNDDALLARTNRALREAGAVTALAVPLTHRGELMGGLFLASTSVPLDDPDRLAFVTSVAGQIAQALALVRTFSQKVESERQAQETAGTLRAMMESMADGVVVADLAGSCLYRNAAAEDLVQLVGVGAPVPVRGTDWGVFLPDRATPYPPEALPLVRAMHGERVQSAEIFVRHEAAREGVWLSVNAMPLLDAQARRRGGVAVFRDVTAEKSAQEQLMVSDRMASIGMLAAGVAHEINNPLAVVIGNTELALEELDALVRAHADPKIVSNLRAELDDVLVAGNRVRDIARDLKLFSRAEEEKLANVDVREVAESAIRLAWNEIRHRARLQKDFQEVPAVRVNESRLGQVLLNLVVNAAQAIREGNAQENVIRVATRSDAQNRVLIEVSDTGPGIPADVLHRLFTPFFTTKPAGAGTGLGLAICRRLITAVGGEITVESRVGRGTTFRVHLPASREALRTSRPPPAASERPAPGASILVIDDEVAVIRAIQRVLGGQHRVAAFSHAAAALQTIVEGTRYDLIISDLVMPEMTGMDFYEELLRVAPDQAERIVFLTGGAFTPRAREFLDQVAATCLDKPFNPQALRDLVNERVH